jgi:hypothetical protein
VLWAVTLELTAALDLNQECIFKIWFTSSSSKTISATVLLPDQGSQVPMWSAKVNHFLFGI